MNFVEIKASYFEELTSLSKVLEYIKSKKIFLDFKKRILGVINDQEQGQIFNDLQRMMTKILKGHALDSNDRRQLESYFNEEQISGDLRSLANLEGRRMLRQLVPDVVNIPVFPDREGLRLDLISFDAELNRRLFEHVSAVESGQELVGVCAVEGCNNLFVPQTTLQRYCSVRCRERQKKRSYKHRREQQEL